MNKLATILSAATCFLAASLTNAALANDEWTGKTYWGNGSSSGPSPEMMQKYKEMMEKRRSMCNQGGSGSQGSGNQSSGQQYCPNDAGLTPQIQSYLIMRYRYYMQNPNLTADQKADIAAKFKAKLGYLPSTGSDGAGDYAANPLSEPSFNTFTPQGAAMPEVSSASTASGGGLQSSANTSDSNMAASNATGGSTAETNSGTANGELDLDEPGPHKMPPLPKSLVKW